MTDGSSFLKGLAVTAGLVIACGAGASFNSPELPDGFADAAQVGQLTQRQAEGACFDAQAEYNSLIRAQRGSSKFTPQEDFDFHCAEAAVITRSATAAPTTAP